MMTDTQRILTADNGYSQLDAYLTERKVRHILLVCGRSIRFLKLNDYFNGLEQRLQIKVTRFSDYKPNPDYESAVKGVKVFRENGCDQIIAVGGGSPMDVAKCIKLYATMDPDRLYLEQTPAGNDIPLLAIPTTAGTGSEATRFAVVYYQGNKQSVAHESIIPSAVLFDPSTLENLPLYQRKATMLDALCHATESFWSVNATPGSQDISRQAIREILSAKDGYLANDPAGNRAMLFAASMAGRAINLTQTTAGHAMCYKLTSLYGLSHGHAAALCVKALWPFMIGHTQQVSDQRGSGYLEDMFDELAAAYGAESKAAAAGKFACLVDSLELPAPEGVTQEDIDVLTHSVNPVRLKNNPVCLTEEQIRELYLKILFPDN